MLGFSGKNLLLSSFDHHHHHHQRYYPADDNVVNMDEYKIKKKNYLFLNNLCFVIIKINKGKKSYPPNELLYSVAKKTSNK